MSHNAQRYQYYGNLWETLPEMLSTLSRHWRDVSDVIIESPCLDKNFTKPFNFDTCTPTRRLEENKLEQGTDKVISSKNQQKMTTTPGVPRRSPIQVLTGPDAAWLQWSDGNWYFQHGMVVADGLRPTMRCRFLVHASFSLDWKLPDFQSRSLPDTFT